jgi:hypothetical protein
MQGVDGRLRRSAVGVLIDLRHRDVVVAPCSGRVTPPAWSARRSRRLQMPRGRHCQPADRVGRRMPRGRHCQPADRVGRRMPQGRHCQPARGLCGRESAGSQPRGIPWGRGESRAGPGRGWAGRRRPGRAGSGGADQAGRGPGAGFVAHGATRSPRATLPALDADFVTFDAPCPSRATFPLRRERFVTRGIVRPPKVTFRSHRAPTLAPPRPPRPPRPPGPPGRPDRPPATSAARTPSGHAHPTAPLTPNPPCNYPALGSSSR